MFKQVAEPTDLTHSPGKMAPPKKKNPSEDQLVFPLAYSNKKNSLMFLHLTYHSNIKSPQYELNGKGGEVGVQINQNVQKQ